MQGNMISPRCWQQIKPWTLHRWGRADAEAHTRELFVWFHWLYHCVICCTEIHCAVLWSEAVDSQVPFLCISRQFDMCLNSGSIFSQHKGIPSTWVQSCPDSVVPQHLVVVRYIVRTDDNSQFILTLYEVIGTLENSICMIFHCPWRKITF